MEKEQEKGKEKEIREGKEEDQKLEKKANGQEREEKGKRK